MTPVTAVLTVLGFIAALIARRGVAVAAGQGGVAEHLRRLFTLIALLLAFRFANFVSTSPLFVACTMVVAAWIPLATLRLGEELVRRHAGRSLKLAAYGGAVVFSLLAMTLGLVWAREAILALATFQAIVLAGSLIHLLRHRNTVAPSERRAVDLLAAAFLLAAPLLATDFVRLFPELPFRGGPFAALVLMLACSRLATGSARPLGLLADIALVALVAAATGWGAFMTSPDPQAASIVAACAAAAAAVLLLVERFGGRAKSENSVLRQVVNSGTAPGGILAAHPLLASASPLGEAEFADLPDGTVEQLAKRRVLSLGTSTGLTPYDGAARELLGRYGATHLLRHSQHPPRFLAICGGALEEDALTLELEVVARLLESGA